MIILVNTPMESKRNYILNAFIAMCERNEIHMVNISELSYIDTKQISIESFCAMVCHLEDDRIIMDKVPEGFQLEFNNPLDLVKYTQSFWNKYEEKFIKEHIGSIDPEPNTYA